MSITIKPIHTAADHAEALATIERLWDSKPGTREGDALEVLATLVDAYEREHTPILPPDPIEAILFRLEQQGKSRKELEPILGTRARVSEILSGKRALSLAMIRRLHHELRIPLEVLVSERRVAPARARKATKRRAEDGTTRRSARAYLKREGIPKLTKGEAKARQAQIDAEVAGTKRTTTKRSAG